MAPSPARARALSLPLSPSVPLYLQSRSLIVGLGDYKGGHLVVEGSEANIRYKPLEFDGWNQRHWTLPFEGERFSVVWFTPMGCDVPPPPLPRAPLYTTISRMGAGTAGADGGGAGWEGLELPALGWGSFRLRGPAVYKGVRAAMEAGYELLDSASSYRDEEALAEAMAALMEASPARYRSELFITSKLAPRELGFQKAVQACVSILERLKTGYLDLLLIHWPGAAGDADAGERGQARGAAAAEEDGDALRLETWRALEHLYERGLVRHIGVSNFTMRHLEALLPHCQVMVDVWIEEARPHGRL